MNQRIVFSYPKQKIAEFAAESLQVAREPNGLLLSAEGEMVFQDTALLAEIANRSTQCRVTLEKEGETVIDQPFQVTFFTLEAQSLVALLQE